MAYIIPRDVFQNPNAPFELDPPDASYKLTEAVFFEGWNNAVDDGQVKWASIEWLTVDLFNHDVANGLFNTLAYKVLLEGGGAYPLMFRLYHKTVYDVHVPDQYCLPNGPGGFGGCHDIPFIGGSHVATMHSWTLQAIYHNPLPIIGFWGFAAIVVSLLFVAAVITQIKGGDLVGTFTEPLKEVIEESGKAANAAIGGVTTTLILGLVFLGALTVVFPRLQASTGISGSAGPISVQTGASSGGSTRIPSPPSRSRSRGP